MAMQPRRRGLVEVGEVLRSKTGRLLAPVPKFNAGGNGARRAVTLVQAWLLAEARKEATNDGWMTLLLKDRDVKNLSPSDADMLNDVVFGHVDGPGDEHRVQAALAL